MYESYLKTFRYEKSDTPFCAVRLLVEPYRNVLLYVGKNVQEDESQRIVFDYEIVSVPETFTEQMINEDFDQLIGGIMLAIIEQGNYAQPDTH